MWLRNSIAILLLPLVLAACGFEPMYGERAQKGSASGSKALAGVDIEPISGRVGQLLSNALEDHLTPGGVAASPAYRLKATVNYINLPISIARDGTVARYNINFTSQYVLTRIADNVALTSGTVTYTTSYNNLANSYYSTYVAEQDALKRGARALADLYRQRLAIYLDAGAKPSDNIVIPSNESPITPDSLLRQQQGTTINLQ